MAENTEYVLRWLHRALVASQRQQKTEAGQGTCCSAALSSRAKVRLHIAAEVV